MNEVEKMYRNAHVYPKIYGDITKETFENKVFNMGDMCNEAFTPEKQLEITKLIGLRYGLKFIVNEAMDCMLSTDLFNDDKFNIQGYGYGYDEAIANLTNNIWQDLTEEERKQIKEVLE